MFPHHTLRRSVSALLLTATTVAMATVPSSLRALSDSYQALRTGMSVNTALELMGTPKTRSDSSWLGVQYADLTWVDIAQVTYRAKFVGDNLVHKSATSGAE